MQIGRWLTALGCMLLLWLLNSCSDMDHVDYNAQVKPLLNKHCISCHGGVKQQGGFNLLTRDLAMGELESGKHGIVPGDASASLMIKRIKSKDPELRMPIDKPPLSSAEINILEKWIDQGAVFETHWAYKPLHEVTPPPEQKLGGLDADVQTSSPIDRFIRAKLSTFDLEQNSQADRATLLRRISLDLIGMPPPDDIRAWYLSETSENSEALLIDRLMNLPQFGEKWASMWLDIARYADSKGYERDPHRNIWRYRDWVIRAFNADMPYDQFITEQLAGDLLDNPTDQQLLATGFHRNTSTNDEGGTDNEEYRTYAVFDRVNTTYEGLLSTTMACVQCHSHPYDPILHKEFYQSMAFFNNSRDGDTSPDYPLLRHFDSADSLRLDSLTEWMSTKMQEEEVAELRLFLKTWMPSWHSIETDSLENAAHYDMKYLGLRQKGSARLADQHLTGKKNLYLRYRTQRADGRLTFRLDHRTGREIASLPLPHTQGKWKIERFEWPTSTDLHDLYFSYYSPSVTVGDDRPQVRFDWIRLDDVELPFKKDDDHWKAVYANLLQTNVRGTPIMMENPEDMRRTTYRFDRGNFLVPDGEVMPAIPAELGPWPETLPKNRLGLAQWIASPENPLAARTWVNRIWAQLFGHGLVETLEDFGSQGAFPSHPELLDWLAWQMIHEYDWSLKSFLHTVMSSNTYLQSSEASQASLEVDPGNVLYARGPRVRLTAEQIRDQALAAAGLLRDKMYGPSVMPYQPVEWNIPYSNEQWKTSRDGDQHRRAIYTYWKRSSPYPAMMIYDAAERDVCSARRIRTNTPLHALVTLNDPVFMEAAAHLAQWMSNHTSTISEAIAAGYERLLFRKIRQEELEIFLTLFKQSITEFRQQTSSPNHLLAYIGEDGDEDMAALIMVANAMMNIDEYITKD